MSGYIGNIPVPQATQTRQSFTATASQTTFNTAGYSPGYIDVFLNGVKLAPADYTATNGSDIILAVGAASGDILEIVAYEIFQVVDQDFTGDFTVDGTTFVVDSTNNRVGIGTTSPSANLEITQSGNNVGLLVAGGGYNYTAKFESSDAEANIIIEDSNSTNDGNRIGVATNDMYFITDNSERMRIDSSGRLLLGTTTAGESSADDLTIATTGQTGITLRSGTANAGAIYFADGTSGTAQYSGYIYYGHSNNALGFATNATERMRIDSSGNLLVGTTNTSLFSTTTEQGLAFLAGGGQLTVSRSNAQPYIANRLGTDGTLFEFRKDGTTVGSIGTYGGSPYIGVDDTGLAFYQGVNAVVPFYPTAVAENDNFVDLGRPAGRFKDLYLSGGVFLGGTGASNKLDDYEEGTWTPVLSSSSGESGQSYTSQDGKYTKVGSLVYCSAWINVASIGTLGGSYALFKGLPFTVGSGNGNYGGGVIQHWTGFNVNSAGFTLYTEPNTTYCYVHYRSSFGTSVTYLSPAGWGTSPNLMVTITYRTDA